ncbi:MAG: TetR/AcrR family transcriptional regulator [Actinomycetota bacterium]|nr:TetR/AcrR family transcriptional regulator [Actinomycetota bacterium]
MSDGRRTDRRDRLVDGAMDLFRRRGPNGAGVGAVCEAAGTTKGVFGHHFPGGKDELVAEVVRRNAEQVDQLVDHALATQPSVGAAVRWAFGVYADLLVADPDLGCPIAAAVVDTHADSASVRAVTADAFARWQDRLTGALAERGVASPRAEDLAVTVVAAMEGAILLAVARRAPEMLRTTGAVLADLLDAEPSTTNA